MLFLFIYVVIVSALREALDFLTMESLMLFGHTGVEELFNKRIVFCHFTLIILKIWTNNEPYSQ